MQINSTIAQFYAEQKTKHSKLFKAHYKNKVSIHEVININAGIKNDRFMLARKNDVNLLRLVIKNDNNLIIYLQKFQLDYGHKRRYYNFKKYLKRLALNKCIKHTNI